jgi:hypothetical protein
VRAQDTIMGDAAFPGVAERAEAEAKPENRIVVAQVLEHPHPVTQATKRAFKRARVDDYGAIKCQAADAFYVRIAPATADRVLLIVDALMKACDARGFSVRPGKEGGGRYRNHASLIVDEEALDFSIEERVRREVHKLTEKEIADRRRYGYSYAPKYDHVPTGQLTLKITSSYGSGLRSTWSDTRHQRLEDCLNQVVAGLVHVAACRRAERLKEQERQKRVEVEQERRAALRRRLNEERQAVARLEEAARDWHRAEQIRAYVAAIEAKAIGGGELSEDKAEWIAWARSQADRIDPLRETPTSILDIDEESIRPLRAWERVDDVSP